MAWAALLVTANFAGMAAYLFLASGGWRDPNEGGAIPLTGEPFVWASCLPVAFLFLAANVCWGMLIVAKKLTPWSPYGLTVVLWMTAVVIDFAHH